MNIDEKYLLRCIELGKNGLGSTAPNPMVGCVVVHNKKIIGEGFTSPYGGAHAEVNAINSVKDKTLLGEATLYVTLEPCSHFGKTPPCSDYILRHHIPKVVIGLQDPHDKVAGKGIEKLRSANCEVVVGVLEEACRQHHKRFLTFQEKQRPYIILKWAETQDGYIAPKTSRRTKNPEPFWITNAYSRQLVHQWRSEEMAILVGTNTVMADNPKLNVRSHKGTSPIRVVLDADLRLPKNVNVLDGVVKTILIHDIKTKKDQINGVDLETIDFEGNVIVQICNVLFKYQISSIIVEGGLKTLQSFIDADFWDEARIFKGPTIFGGGVKAPKISGTIKHSTTILTDTLTILEND